MANKPRALSEVLDLKAEDELDTLELGDLPELKRSSQVSRRRDVPEQSSENGIPDKQGVLLYRSSSTRKPYRLRFVILQDAKLNMYKVDDNRKPLMSELKGSIDLSTEGVVIVNAAKSKFVVRMSDSKEKHNFSAEGEKTMDEWVVSIGVHLSTEIANACSSPGLKMKAKASARKFFRKTYSDVNDMARDDATAAEAVEEENLAKRQLTSSTVILEETLDKVVAAFSNIVSGNASVEDGRRMLYTLTNELVNNVIATQSLLKTISGVNPLESDTAHTSLQEELADVVFKSDTLFGRDGKLGENITDLLEGLRTAAHRFKQAIATTVRITNEGGSSIPSRGSAVSTIDAGGGDDDEHDDPTFVTVTIADADPDTIDTDNVNQKAAGLPGQRRATTSSENKNIVQRKRDRLTTMWPVNWGKSVQSPLNPMESATSPHKKLSISEGEFSDSIQDSIKPYAYESNLNLFYSTVEQGMKSAISSANRKTPSTDGLSTKDKRRHSIANARFLLSDEDELPQGVDPTQQLFDLAEEQDDIERTSSLSFGRGGSISSIDSTLSDATVRLRSSTSNSINRNVALRMSNLTVSGIDLYEDGLAEDEDTTRQRAETLPSVATPGSTPTPSPNSSRHNSVAAMSSSSLATTTTSTPPPTTTPTTQSSADLERWLGRVEQASSSNDASIMRKPRSGSNTSLMSQISMGNVSTSVKLRDQEVAGRTIARVMSASLPELVNHLLSDENEDPNFLPAFLMCLEIFTTPTKLVTLLIEHHVALMEMWLNVHAEIHKERETERCEEREKRDSQNVRAMQRSCFVLVEVLQVYGMVEDDALRYKIVEMSRDLMKTGRAEVAQQIRRVILLYDGDTDTDGDSTTITDAKRRRRMRKARRASIISKATEDSVTPNPPSSLSSTSTLPPAATEVHTPLSSLNITTVQSSIFDCSSMSIAKQLSLIDERVFMEVAADEVLAWRKKQEPELSPNVFAMITQFNRTSMWAATTILMQLTLTERAKAFQKLVDVCKCLRKLRSFNMLMAVLSAFNSSAVHRLSHTQFAAGTKTRTVLERLKSLMSCDGGFVTLRSALETCRRPAIPYLGMYLSDITLIHHGNRDYVEPSAVDEEVPMQDQEPIVNFAKMRKVHDVIHNIQFFQEQGHNLASDSIVEAMLGDFEHEDADRLFEISLYAEPRDASIDDIA